jgi:hypothetical protein
MARGVGNELTEDYVYVLIVWGCDWDCASDYHDTLVLIVVVSCPGRHGNSGWSHKWQLTLAQKN